MTVVGWDRNEVVVTGYLADDAEELRFSGTAKKTRIEVEYPRKVKTIEVGAELVIMAAYSAMKNIANFTLLYSV